MNFRILIAVALMSSIHMYVCASENSPTKTVSWPSCLGQICFSPKLPDAKSTVQKFGAFSLSKKEEDKSFCYESNNKFLTIVVHNDEPSYVSSIYLSQSSTCASIRRSKLELNSIATPEGLSLGSKLARVLKLYGEPNVVEVATKTIKWKEAKLRINEVKSESMLIYGPISDKSIFQASIYIKDGLVSGIELSNSE